MRKSLKAGLALLLVLSLFVAPASLAADEGETGQSLIEWIQDVILDVDSQDEEDSGPAIDPIG